MSFKSNSSEVPENMDIPPEAFKLSIQVIQDQSASDPSKPNGQKLCNAEKGPPRTTTPSDKKPTGCVSTKNTGFGDQNQTQAASKQQPREPKAKTPGWLISDLDPEYLMNMLSIKIILKTMKSNHREMMEHLFELMNTYLQIDVSEDEIMRALMAIPWTVDEGPSFVKFLLYMANFDAAEHMHVNNEWKSSYTPLNGTQKKKVGNQEGGGSKSVQTKKSQNGSNKKTPTKKFSRGEKILYTGILIFEMHRTLQSVENLGSESLMPKAEKKLKKLDPNRDMIGIKKKGSVAWDKPLPPLPKKSPYAARMPFLIPDEVEKPKDDKNKKRSTKADSQPKHLTIEPPRKKDDEIRITDNRKKIREALKFLVGYGDCTSFLPDVQYLTDLIDSTVDKVGRWILNLDSEIQREEKKLTKKPGKDLKAKSLGASEPKISDSAWIGRKAKSLYQCQSVPKELAMVKPLIKYTDGLNLRTLCNHMRQNHWAKLSSEKLKFRNSAWGKMNADEIPSGELRDSFVYTFVTYFPYVSHLPTVHDQNSNAF